MDFYEIKKVGLFGFGKQMQEYLLPVILCRQDAVPVAICRKKNDLKRQTFAGTSVPTAKDLLEQLEEREISTVIAATNAAHHEKVISHTLSVGVDCFVEKPPALYTTNLQELVTIAKGSSAIAAVGLNFRYSAALNTALDVFDQVSGDGERYARIFFKSSVNRSEPNTSKADQIRSFLVEFGIHPIDFAVNKLLASSPKDVDTSVSSDGNKIQIRFRDDKKWNEAVVSISNASGGFQNRLELTSSNGAQVSVDNLSDFRIQDPNCLAISDRVFNGRMTYVYEWPMRRDSLARNGYRGCLDAFFDKSDFATIESLVEVYKLIDRLTGEL